MSTHSHLVLATIVVYTQWTTDRLGVLRCAHAALHERAQQQDLQLLGEPVEKVEILPGETRVRITLSVETGPARAGLIASPSLPPTQNH